MSGDQVQYAVARADMRRGIKDAMVAYKSMVEDHLADEKNPRQMWQGLKQLANYNSSVPASVHASLAE